MGKGGLGRKSDKPVAFSQRVDNSLNKVVNTVSNSTFLSSQLRKDWRSVLYVLPVA